MCFIGLATNECACVSGSDGSDGMFLGTAWSSHSAVPSIRQAHQRSSAVSMHRDVHAHAWRTVEHLRDTHLEGRHLVIQATMLRPTYTAKSLTSQRGSMRQRISHRVSRLHGRSLQKAATHIDRCKLLLQLMLQLIFGTERFHHSETSVVNIYSSKHRWQQEHEIRVLPCT